MKSASTHVASRMWKVEGGQGGAAACTIWARGGAAIAIPGRGRHWTGPAPAMARRQLLTLALLAVGRSGGLPTPPRLLITSGDGAEGFSMAVDLASLRDPTSLIACVDDIQSRKSKALEALGVDVRDRGSGLQRCFAGATYALLLPPLTADREARGAELINASVTARDRADDGSARLSGVFLLSVIGAEGEHAPASLRVYAAVERLLADEWGDAPGKVVLRTSFYQQNLLLWSHDAQHERALRLPLSDTACFAPLSSSDVAAVVAHLSISEQMPETVAFRDIGAKVPTSAPSPGSLPTLELSGPRWLSGATAAALATAATGAPLAWEAAGADTVEGVLHAAGLDPSEGKLLIDMMGVQSVNPGPGRSCDDLPPLPDTPRLLGRPASPLSLFFVSHASAFAPAAPEAHTEAHSESHSHEHVHAAGWHGRVIHGYEAVPWQHAVVVGTSLIPLAAVGYAYYWARTHPGSILYASFFPSVFTGRDLQANWNVM